MYVKALARLSNREKGANQARATNSQRTKSLEPQPSHHHGELQNAPGPHFSQ